MHLSQRSTVNVRRMSLPEGTEQIRWKFNLKNSQKAKKNVSIFYLFIVKVKIVEKDSDWAPEYRYRAYISFRKHNNIFFMFQEPFKFDHGSRCFVQSEL